MSVEYSYRLLVTWLSFAALLLLLYFFLAIKNNLIQ